MYSFIIVCFLISIAAQYIAATLGKRPVIVNALFDAVSNGNDRTKAIAAFEAARQACASGGTVNWILGLLVLQKKVLDVPLIGVGNPETIAHLMGVVCLVISILIMPLIFNTLWGPEKN